MLLINFVNYLIWYHKTYVFDFITNKHVTVIRRLGLSYKVATLLREKMKNQWKKILIFSGTNIGTILCWLCNHLRTCCILTKILKPQIITSAQTTPLLHYYINHYISCICKYQICCYDILFADVIAYLSLIRKNISTEQRISIMTLLMYQVPINI